MLSSFATAYSIAFPISTPNFQLNESAGNMPGCAAGLPLPRSHGRRRSWTPLRGNRRRGPPLQAAVRRAWRTSGWEHRESACLFRALPAIHSFRAAREIGKLIPGVPILMFSMHVSPQLVAEARDAGCRGAVSKTDVDHVIEGVEALLHNQAYFPQIH